MSPSSPAVKTAFRFVALVLASLQAWAYRFYIEPDGVKYLEIARAYLRRDWTNALNAYWSPLYSWLLAFMRWVFQALALLGIDISSPSQLWSVSFDARRLRVLPQSGLYDILGVHGGQLDLQGGFLTIPIRRETRRA